MPSEACIKVPVRACSCRWSSSVRCRHVRSFLDHHLATPPALHTKGLCALPNSDRTRGSASAEAPHEHPLHLSRRAHAATLQQKFLPNGRISNFSSTLRPLCRSATLIPHLAVWAHLRRGPGVLRFKKAQDATLSPLPVQKPIIGWVIPPPSNCP